MAELVGPVLRSAFAAFAGGHAPASVSRARSTWTALFDLLVADDHLAGNPMAAVPRPRLAPRAPKPLLGWDKDTVQRLVDFVMSGERPGPVVWPELDRVVIALLLGTGLRSGELLKLHLGAYESAQGDASSGWSERAAKPRTVPAPEPLPALVGAYLASRRERFAEWRRLPSQALLVAPSRDATPLVTRRAGGRRLTECWSGAVRVNVETQSPNRPGHVTEAAVSNFAALVGNIGQGLDYYRKYRNHHDFQRRLAMPATTISQRAPVALWNEQGITFVFGLPTGWRELTPQELDSLSANSGKRVSAGGIVDGPPLQIITVHVDALDGDPKEYAQLLYAYPEQVAPRIAAAQRMTPFGPPYRVRLGGQPSVLFHFDGWAAGSAFGLTEASIRVRQTEIFAVRWASGVVFSIQAVVEDHAKALIAFDTAASTWFWRS